MSGCTLVHPSCPLLWSPKSPWHYEGLAHQRLPGRHADTRISGGALEMGLFSWRCSRDLRKGNEDVIFHRLCGLGVSKAHKTTGKGDEHRTWCDELLRFQVLPCSLKIKMLVLQKEEGTLACILGVQRHEAQFPHDCPVPKGIKIAECSA